MVFKVCVVLTPRLTTFLGVLEGVNANSILCRICRVGQNHIYTYIYTVYLVISKPNIPYVHRIYMVLANH